MAATSKDAEQFGRYCGFTRVLISGWNGKEKQTVTWGKTDKDREEAIKLSEMADKPNIQALKKKIRELEAEIARLNIDHPK